MEKASKCKLLVKFAFENDKSICYNEKVTSLGL
jgi:hypothetical protein